MVRLQTAGMALALMLTLFPAGSTASAQGRYSYRPGTSGYNCYSGSSYGTPGSSYWLPIPSYGSNVYSRNMKLVHQQVARRLAAENSRRTVEAYFERKRANIEGRRTLKAARIQARFAEQRAIANLKHEYADVIEMNHQYAAELARRLAPNRLTESEYNAVTATISWPLLLQEDQRFAEKRARIDALFAQRTPYNSGLGSRNSRQVREATDQMKNTLKTIQGEFEGTAYAVARKFLGSVAHEARFTADTAVGKLAAK